MPDRRETIKTFCEIQTIVARDVFNYSTEADCFCADSASADARYFRNSGKVADWILFAVTESVRKHLASASAITHLRLDQDPDNAELKAMAYLLSALKDLTSPAAFAKIDRRAAEILTGRSKPKPETRRSQHVE